MHVAIVKLYYIRWNFTHVIEKFSRVSHFFGRSEATPCLKKLSENIFHNNSNKHWSKFIEIGKHICLSKLITEIDNELPHLIIYFWTQMPQHCWFHSTLTLNCPLSSIMLRTGLLNVSNTEELGFRRPIVQYFRMPPAIDEVEQLELCKLLAVIFQSNLTRSQHIWQ